MTRAQAIYLLLFCAAGIGAYVLGAPEWIGYGIAGFGGLSLACYSVVRGWCDGITGSYADGYDDGFHAGLKASRGDGQAAPAVRIEPRAGCVPDRS